MIPPFRPSPTFAPIPVDFPTAQSQTTDQLIESCLRGDQSAWDEIVQTYWRRVFNVAYKFVGRHEEAEDLSQEIFLKLYRALHTFDRRANFQTWLISISRNLCVDHYRSVRRESETVDRNVDAASLSPTAPGPDALSRLHRRDRRDLLRRGMLTCQGRSKSRPRWRRKSRPPSRWGGVAEGGLRTPGRLRGAGPSCCGQDDSSRRSAPGCGRDGSAGRAGRRSAVRSRRSPSIR